MRQKRGDPARIHVTGASLAGLAAAIRLARLGHQVSLDPAGPLGGRSCGRTLTPGSSLQVDDLEPVLTLPAAWRDLMKKSGRPFTAELARHHLELVPAPPAVHRWHDGTELTLPDDRAGHLAALTETLGAPAAERWTTLLDQVDDVWQALRLAGVERPFPAQGPDPTQAQALWSRRTLGHLAKDLREPRLAALLLSAGQRAGACDPERAPAWLATRWTLPRTFGRWHLSCDQTALPLSALVQVLTDRLIEREVALEPTAPDADAHLDARAPAPPRGETSTWARLRGRGSTVTAVRPPRTSHDLHPDLDPVEGLQESVFHTREGIVVGWQRTTAEGVMITSHDHTRPREPDPEHGWDLSGWTQWTVRPPLEPALPAAAWTASAASHAGNEPWAELLSAALATYLLHEHLTGEDIRPTNKAGTARR